MKKEKKTKKKKKKKKRKWERETNNLIETNRLIISKYVDT